MDKKIEQLPQLFLRLALAVTMLSAVADRFGFWGENSTWGNWQNFEKYTTQLTFFLPPILNKFSAYTATFLEIALSLLLLSGFKVKLTAIVTGILLLLFALSMSISLGVKAPLDYSVLVGSSAAFLLAAQKNNSQ
ncbi:DoxX family membrane protein [Flavobacterium panici]|uniref:DoxX family membrane protein n=1 Tax=Flavobacterium panici TaxID=2654843 RepID=A0A9N8J4T9_9FLAO|nr:DoxX family membrane protein [Flavobacterium panici]CAC9975448.1 DoxX family membrane protein [Flavobacterium panici]